MVKRERRGCWKAGNLISSPSSGTDQLAIIGKSLYLNFNYL